MMGMGMSKDSTKLKHDMSGDGFDDWVMSVNWAFGYLDQTIDFPEVDDAKPGDGIEPEWFLEALAGTPDFSELNAIKLYRADVNKFDDIATVFSGISFVEMMHYDHLQEFILAIGGQVDNIPYSNKVLARLNEKSKNNKAALRVAIKGEQDTIDEYNRIMAKCKAAKDSVTKTLALQLLNKLIADEKTHIKFFQKELDKLTGGMRIVAPKKK